MASPVTTCASRGLILEAEDTVGIAKIDGQHRFLASLYNNMMKILEGDGNHEHGIYGFTEFFSYVNYHFSSEEQIMRRVLYPEYRSHLFDHRNLIATLELLGRRIRQRDDGAVMLAKVIGQWLFCHIRIADKDLGWYLAVDSAFNSVDTAVVATAANQAGDSDLERFARYPA